ncbi:hypothetical protein [Thalassiella azotivora]
MVDTVEHVLAAAFGTSLGILLTWATVPRVDRWAASAVAALVAVTAVGLSRSAAPNGYVTATLVVTMLAGFLGTRPVRWADHKLLSGSGYWERLALTTMNNRRLRESSTPQDSAGADVRDPADR